MARQDQIQEDGRAFEIRNINVSSPYLDPGYVLKCESDASISPTGEWTIFRLEHPDGHYYRGRWDEKERELDVDLFPTSSAQIALNDFRGHHTHRSNLDGWTFDIDVYRDSASIFSGSVTFSLVRKVAFEASTPPWHAALTRSRVKAIAAGFQEWTASLTSQRREGSRWGSAWRHLCDLWLKQKHR